MDDNKYDLNKTWDSSTQPSTEVTLACDPDKYREHLDELELSEQEQDELLKTLWSIMAGFVDMGFGVDSIQFLPKDQLSASNSTEADRPVLTAPSKE